MSHSSFALKTLAAAIILASTASIGFAKSSKIDYKAEVCPTCSTPQLLSGFYVGGQVGYDAYKVHRDQNLPIGPSNLLASNDAVATGWMGGIMIGYGVTIGNGFYLGGELTGNGSNAEGETNASIVGPGALTDNIKTEVRSSYGAAFLPGAKLGDNYLTYLRLGWNWANLKETVHVIFPGSLDRTASKSNTSDGFVAGIGMEGLLAANWSLRGEYNHTWYSSFTVNDAIIGTCKVTPSDNQYTLGVIYHFA